MTACGWTHLVRVEPAPVVRLIFSCGRREGADVHGRRETRRQSPPERTIPPASPEVFATMFSWFNASSVPRLPSSRIASCVLVAPPGSAALRRRSWGFVAQLPACRICSCSVRRPGGVRIMGPSEARRGTSCVPERAGVRVTDDVANTGDRDVTLDERRIAEPGAREVGCTRATNKHKEDIT